MTHNQHGLLDAVIGSLLLPQGDNRIDHIFRTVRLPLIVPINSSRHLQFVVEKKLPVWSRVQLQFNENMPIELERARIK